MLYSLQSIPTSELRYSVHLDQIVESTLKLQVLRPRCEFLHETRTAPVYPCQDTSALQEVLKKALEKATWC